MDKKSTGSYYTPAHLARFLAERSITRFSDTVRISVLEPSVGDGAIVQALAGCLKDKQKELDLTAVDINEQALKKAKNVWKSKTSRFIHKDFLNFETKKKFSLICGNPPYVKKSLLSEDQLKKCEEIHAKENLSKKSIKNIWTAFVVKANRLLADEGVLAFILPAEVLQVSYAAEIRTLLQKSFERIEVFTFSDLMFENKLQDVVVLIAYKKSDLPGVFYGNIDSRKQLTQNTVQLEPNAALTHSQLKWAHHILTKSEIELIERLREKLKSIGSYCDTKPGIVTAANSYFIVDKIVEDTYDLSVFTLPILPRGFYVNGSVSFDLMNHEELIAKSIPTRLIAFPNKLKEAFSERVREYLEIGTTQKLDERYKCKLRDHWYVIPNIATPAEGFFFKRCYHYPKVIKNVAEVYVTDSAYKIAMHDGFDINSLIFSFYNSLTLAFAEIDGRYYGGGVLELTPNEFKHLPIPYTKISPRSFEAFRKRFEKKKSIDHLMEVNDSIILKSNLSLSDEEIKIIRSIKAKLVNKRFRRI
jgi:adenine-specific DNA-methyltransferase